MCLWALVAFGDTVAITAADAAVVHSLRVMMYNPTQILHMKTQIVPFPLGIVGSVKKHGGNTAAPWHLQLHYYYDYHYCYCYYYYYHYCNDDNILSLSLSLCIHTYICIYMYI